MRDKAHRRRTKRDLADSASKHYHDNPIIKTLVDHDDESETTQGSLAETDIPKLQTYLNYVLQFLDYEWLLTNLRREILLAPSMANTLRNIRLKITEILPMSHEVSSKKSSQTYNIIFEVDWDLLDFLKAQDYEAEAHVAVENVITLTGGPSDAQALTCGQYLCQTWPLSGHQIMRLIQDVLRKESGCRQECRFSNLKSCLLR